MAKQRIRTVKPELFQHEELFNLEKQTGLPVRLAFIGLFTACDREGRFEWKPNVLKLWIMPWDKLNFEEVLGMLARVGFIKKYEVAGRHFGCIPRWKLHQVINAREGASTIPSDASATREARDTDLHTGNGTEQKGTEGNRTELNGREGMQGKGNQKDTNVSLSETGDGELKMAQAKLLEMRKRQGLTEEGKSPEAWNEVRGV